MNSNDPIQDPNAPREGTWYGSASAASNASATGPGYPPPADPAFDAAAYGNATPPPPYAYAPPPPPPPGTPNPGLAALLGFIPGVGAMYNGQFAKGLAHIVIFAVFVSLSDHVNGIFGLLVAGWVFYMVFDAYQTARARRDGMVPPDPFGLNTIGERMGIQGNPAWSDFVARPSAGPADPAAAATAASASSGDAQPFSGSAQPYSGAASYGAYNTVPSTAAGGAYVPPTPPYVDPAAYNAAAYASSSPYGATGYGGGAPYPPGYAAGYPQASTPVPPFVPPPVPAYAPPANPSSGLPTGAFWLIGLGILALIGSLAHNFYWSGRFFSTYSLLIIGIVLVVARTLAARRPYPVGTAASNWYLVHQNRPGVLVFTAGVLQMLDGLHVAYWRTTWPYLLITLGLYQVLDRALYNRMIAEGPQSVAMPFAVPTPAEGTATESASTVKEVQ